MPTYDFKCKSTDCALEVADIIQSMHAPIPPCPVCGGEMEKAYLKAQVIRDEIPGGVLLENLGPNPVRVYSITEYNRLCKMPRTAKDGSTYYLTPMVRHVGVPGSDHSPHTTDWSRGIDPYTMEAARLLVERVTTQGSKHTSDEPEPGDSSFRDPAVKEFNETYDTPTMQEVMAKIRGDDVT